MIGLGIAIALQASAIETPCQKLTRDFAKNEVAFTIMDDAHQSLLAADQNYASATGDYSRVSRRLQTNATSDEKYKADGDRISSLMIGHGCTLPDHVTSPETYRRDMAACDAAKGTAQEQTACAFVDRAVERSSPTAKKPVNVRRKR